MHAPLRHTQFALGVQQVLGRDAAFLERHGQFAQRTGLDLETTTILDVELPKVTIYLNPGKNITVVAEVIAMNHLLRYSGINAAEAFNERLVSRMKTAAANNIREYLQEDHE